jgi:nitrogen fixation protein FixH
MIALNQRPPAPASVERAERTARRCWTAGIAGFFGLQALLWTCAIALTARDPSFAVIDDYERRADQWDQVQAARRASQRLGWRIAIELPRGNPSGSNLGDGALAIRLTDRQGQPVSGAAISLRMFHAAEAARPQQVQAAEVEPGQYVAFPQMERPGRWKISGRAVLGDCQFLFDQSCVLDSKERAR